MNIPHGLEPFDFEKYKAGQRAVFRDGTYPVEVHRFPIRGPNERTIMSISSDKDVCWLWEDGMWSQYDTCYYDLFLEPPVVEKYYVVFINLNYQIEALSAARETYIDALKYQQSDRCIDYAADELPTSIVKATYSGTTIKSIELVKP